MQNKSKQTSKTVKRRVKNRRQLGRRRRKIRRNNRIPLAIVKTFRRKMVVQSKNGTSMTIAGKDLIYKIPDQLVTNGDYSLMTIIPCNPAYWLGTRIATIASGYQNYRPIKFNVHYIPQVASTQQGNVLAGSLWSMSPSKENIQQTLKTSNGGILTQCYVPATSKIELGKNLQFNLYRMGGKFDQESNPFIFVALTIATIDQNGTRINPGYFFVDYKFEFRNPIGDTIKYYTSGLIQQQDYAVNYINETLVNCANNEINPGAVIQKDDQTYTWNGKPVTINQNNYVWYFCNDIKTGEPQPDDEDVELDSPYNAIINVEFAGNTPIIQLPTYSSIRGFAMVVLDGATLLYRNKSSTSQKTVVVPDSEATYYSLSFSSVEAAAAYQAHFTQIESATDYFTSVLKDGYTPNFIQI